MSTGASSSNVEYVGGPGRRADGLTLYLHHAGTCPDVHRWRARKTPCR